MSRENIWAKSTLGGGNSKYKLLIQEHCGYAQENSKEGQGGWCRVSEGEVR